LKVAIKEKGGLLIWLLCFIVVVSALVYFVFARPKASGMLTPEVQIVKADNLQQIENYKKYNTPYAIKTQDNTKFYLKYYYNEGNKPVESKLEITSEQFNKLTEGNKYWFMVRFANSDDSTSGTIKEVLTDNPTKK
jgi:hypothetical protein